MTPRPLGRAASHVLAGLLLAFWTVLVVGAGSRVGRTSDEGNYVNAGRTILAEGAWNYDFTRVQGPIPYYAAQLFLDADDPFGDVGPELLARARLGMLPFGLLLGLVIYLWSSRVFGSGGGLVSLGMYTLNPLMIGYGSLVTVDMAHCAFATLALWMTWEFLRELRVGFAVLAGVALGLAIGTKYLAVFYAPIVVVLLMLGALGKLRASEEASASTRPLVAWTLPIWLTAVVVFTLHAAYGFQGGFGDTDPEVYRAGSLQALLRFPVLGQLAAVLPGAFVHGLDFVAVWGEGRWTPYLNGRFAANHWDYHLWGVLLKTPELVLAGFGAWALLRFPALLRSDAPRGERALAVVALPVVVIPFVYFSAFTRAQVGIRYVLLTFPLLFVLAAGITRLGFLQSLPSRGRIVATCLAVVLLAADCLAFWPNLPAYFNRLGGGQAAAWKHFHDTNSDWAQLEAPGLEILRERYGDELTVLRPGDGPRFGRVAAYLTTLVAVDPEDGSRTHHWCQRFEPVDRIDAAWWVFEPDRSVWEELAQDDPRALAELAVATYAAGEVDAALALLDGLDPERADPLRDLHAAALQRATDPASAPIALAVARAWYAVGHADRAESLLEDVDDPAALELRCRLLNRRRAFETVVALLEDRPDVAAYPYQLFALTEALYRLNRPKAALAALDRAIPEASPAHAPGYRQLRAWLERHHTVVGSVAESIRWDIPWD